MSDHDREAGTGSEAPDRPRAPQAVAGDAPAGDPAPPAGDPAPPAGDPRPAARRPLVERVGMAAIAAVLAVLFAGVAAAAFVSGEPFLGIMGGIGAVMTAWAGLLTLVRG